MTSLTNSELMKLSDEEIKARIEGEEASEQKPEESKTEDKVEESKTEESKVEDKNEDGDKKITVDDLELSDEEKNKLKSEEKEKKQTDKEKIEAYNKKQQEKRDKRTAYRGMSHDEKIVALKERYTYDQIISRYIQNDDILPGKDRTITALKNEISNLDAKIAESSKYKEIAERLQLELKAVKKVESKPKDEGPGFVEKWKEDVNEDLLSDMEKRFGKKETPVNTAELEKQIKDLQNQSKHNILVNKERDFQSYFTNAVPDSAKILNSGVYKEIYNSPITNLDENLSGYLIQSLGARATSTTGQVVEWLHQSKDVKAIEPLKYIFDYIRNIDTHKEIKTPKMDKLKNQVQSSTNRGGSRPVANPNDGKFLQSDFLENLKRKFNSGKVSYEEYEKGLTEYKDALTSGRVQN